MSTNTRSAAVTLPDNFILPAAAAVQGIMHASANSLINVALAFYKGLSKDEALKYATNSGNLDRAGRVNAHIHAELADVGEEKLAYAARVGLGQMMGMSRPVAEEWAKLPMGPKRSKGSNTSVIQ